MLVYREALPPLFAWNLKSKGFLVYTYGRWCFPKSRIGNRYSARTNWIESFALARDKKRGNSINDKSGAGHPCLRFSNFPAFSSLSVVHGNRKEVFNGEPLMGHLLWDKTREKKFINLLLTVIAIGGETLSRQKVAQLIMEIFIYADSINMLRYQIILMKILRI